MKPYFFFLLFSTLSIFLQAQNLDKHHIYQHAFDLKNELTDSNQLYLSNEVVLMLPGYYSSQTVKDPEALLKHYQNNPFLKNI